MMKRGGGWVTPQREKLLGAVRAPPSHSVVHKTHYTHAHTRTHTHTPQPDPMKSDGGGDSEWDDLPYQYGFGEWEGARAGWGENGMCGCAVSGRFPSATRPWCAENASSSLLSHAPPPSIPPVPRPSGNEFTSEAVPGALPVGRNSPQVSESGRESEERRRRAPARCCDTAMLTLPHPPTPSPKKKKKKKKQICPYGLYAEQINGTPFTVPRR